MEIEKTNEERAPSRNGRVPSRNQEKRTRVMTDAENVANVLAQNGKLPQENLGRFNTMKKVAEEQRRKVRETRVKQTEEEKVATQMKRNEELRIQIQRVLDEMLEDLRKDLLSNFDQQLREERNVLKREMQSNLETGKLNLTEVEKKLTNGETFEARLSRMKKEFEASFKAIVQKEYAQIHENVVNFVENKLEAEKYRWENNFKREGAKRVKETEEAMRSDFRVGLEDSQKQCGDIIINMEARTSSLEHKINNRIKILNSEAVAYVQESERETCQLVRDKLNERDKMLKGIFHAETEKLRREMNKARSDASNFRSKICVIL